MLGSRPVAFPMEQNLWLNATDGPLLEDPLPYRRLIGRYYMSIARPEIFFFFLHILSQFINQPRKPHFYAALRVLRYLKGTPGQGIPLPTKNKLHVSAYCDSDEPLVQ